MAGPQPSFSRQVFACFTMYTLSMSIGAGSAYSGVVLPQLQAGPDRGGFNLNPDQSSWFASLQANTCDLTVGCCLFVLFW